MSLSTDSLDASTGRRRPRWMTSIAIVSFFGAAALTAWVVFNGDDASGDIPARGDFSVDVEKVPGLEDIEFVRRCGDDGVSAVLSTSGSESARLQVEVRFETQGGELLQLSQLPVVIVEPAVPTRVDLAYDRDRAPIGLREAVPICVVAVREAT